MPDYTVGGSYGLSLSFLRGKDKKKNELENAVFVVVCSTDLRK